MWKDIFHMGTTKDRYVWAQGWEGYQLPKFRIPGSRVAQDVFKPSFSKQYIIRNFGLGDAVSMEDIEDDLYAVINYVLAKKGGLMAQAFMDLMEYQTANYFAINGFASGSSVAGMSDGVSLFSTAHPISASNTAVTFSNRPATDADMSNATAQQMITGLWTQKAPNNLTFLNNKLRAVVYNPAQEFVARQVFRGKWNQNTSDRNENFVNREDVQLIKWPYFQKSGATGTNNAWFGIAEQHHLNFYMHTAPKTKTDYDINTNSQIIITLTRFDYGADDPRGTWGSSGV